MGVCASNVAGHTSKRFQAVMHDQASLRALSDRIPRTASSPPTPDSPPSSCLHSEQRRSPLAAAGKQDQRDPRDRAGRRNRSRFFFLPAGEEEEKEEEEKEDETDESTAMDVLGVAVQLPFLTSLTILFFYFPLFGFWVLPDEYWIIGFPGR